MTLPTIIIATRASIRAVPPSIRDAALGVGASKMHPPGTVRRILVVNN